MKLIIMLLVVIMLFGACAENKRIDGVTYKTYGLLNKDEQKSPDVEYRLVVGNLVWGCLLIETVVMPVYFFGFSLWGPVEIKKGK